MRFVSDVLADVALLHHREAELRRAVESGISTLDALGLQ
jgi:hypothetical protein